MQTQLKHIAYARSGDKGSSSNIGVIAHTPDGFEFLKHYLTADKVKAHFSSLGVIAATRYELPNLLAFNFVLEGILDGGGSRSLRLDAQGKALGQKLLEMPVDIDRTMLTRYLPHEKQTVAYQHVKMELLEGDLIILTLNRPDKRNALNLEFLVEINDALSRIDRHAPRILMIDAEGPSFCTGMDLKETSDQTKIEASAQEIAKLLTAIYQAPCVTIALVHGSAIAGGAGIATACDFILASEDAQFGYPEVHRGLVAAQVAPLLVRAVGKLPARQLLLTGRMISAQEAQEIGLVYKVAKDLKEEAIALANQIYKGAPHAITLTKSWLNDLDSQSFEEQLESAIPVHHQARHSEEAIEGSNAFFEKRAPKWNQELNL